MTVRAEAVMRCLVADDHPALAIVLPTYLEDNGYEVVGPAADGLAAIELAREAQPELALVDYRMPGPGGAELVERLLEVVPGLRIAIYTAEADESIVRKLLAVGAAGVILKEAPLSDLLRALTAIAAGGAYIDPGIAGQTVPRAGSKQSKILTARELEALSRVADGMSQDEIARELGIGTETVRTHLRKARERLGAATKTEAVAAALRQGLIK